jgi:hypothetical protein
MLLSHYRDADRSQMNVGTLRWLEQALKGVPASVAPQPLDVPHNDDVPEDN